jgi:hypothetical protein
MSRINPLSHSVFCSKITLYRFISISGIFFVSYLFVYKIDINTAAIRARDLFVPIITLNRRGVSTVVVPLIRTNSTIPVTNSTPTPAEKVNNVVQTKTLTSTLANESNNNSQNTNTSEQPKEAFVTFSNNHPQYLAVLKVLLDSVHAFSTRHIIVFGIDVDLDLDIKQYPRVIKRRIQQSDCGPVRSYNKNNKFIIHFFFSQFFFVKSMQSSVVI